MALSNKLFSFFLLLVLSFALFGLFTVNVVGTTNTVEHTQDTTPPPVVLFYQANGQLLNSSVMQGAINLLRANGFRVSILNQTLNSTSLIGVNVLIIPNPGANFDFTSSDLAYIGSFMSQPNHGLFLLNNPLSTNTTLASNPTILNNLINNLPASFINCQFESKDPQGVVLQQFNPDNKTFSNILHLPLQNSSTLSFSANTSLVTESNSVTADIPFASVGADTYAVNSTGDYLLQGSSSLILGGAEDTNSSTRLALSGSTLMFSDLPGPNNDNQSWFNSANNSYIWLTIVQWLANAGNTPGIAAVPDTGLLSIFAAVIGIIFVALGIFFFITSINPNISLGEQPSYMSTRKGALQKGGPVGAKGPQGTSLQVGDQSETPTDKTTTSTATSSRKVKGRKN